MTDDDEGRAGSWTLYLLAVFALGIGIVAYIRSGFSKIGTVWGLVGIAIALLVVGAARNQRTAGASSTQAVLARAATGVTLGLLGLVLGLLALVQVVDATQVGWAAILVTGIGAAWTVGAAGTG